ncbi:hypothetical protein DL767_002100 [Monosporascus sp. MG133]|nr:hypothetical protein DL767_002100 [Monosporascus sp. MG133]
MAESQQAPALSFPTDPSEFDSDERISFSRLENKFIAVQDDGSEFEFDKELKRWIPILDEELIRQQQMAYGGPAPEDDDDDDAAADDQRQQPNRRRRRDGSSDQQQQRPQKKQKQPPQPRQNTAIYVTGLPLDATVEEVHEVFSRKCGVIAEEIDSGRPRIKLYTDERGNFKGDALIVFFKPQSVEMAIMLLDDTDFRYSPSGLASGRMRVQAADSSYKKTSYEKEGEEGAGGSGGGGGEGGSSESREGSGNGNANGGGATSGSQNNNNNHKPRDRAREQEKKKIIKRTQKLDAKLADWDDDDPYGAQLETNARRERLVILRHMFTLRELDEDPAALLEIKEDVREECAKLGPVTNVVLYDLEPDGVVAVKFRHPEAAEACVRLMDGRAFDGRIVRAAVATGRERFRKSGRKQDDDRDDEDDNSDEPTAAPDDD